MPKIDGLSYGGDYNPEQWPEEVEPHGVTVLAEERADPARNGAAQRRAEPPIEGRT